MASIPAVADDDDARPYSLGASSSSASSSSRNCPFLDTIQRPLLDFDMQKVCSVSLSPHSVYCCLVCGKYFRGRGKGTPAMTHSLQASHHVFIHLFEGRVWCLPDAYEVTHASLDDIRFALQPRFSAASLRALDGSVALARDATGLSYLPGFVGLNNLGRTDGVSVVAHALAHVAPLRDYFLLHGPGGGVGGGVGGAAAPPPSRLVGAFGDLVRKLWSPAAFKSTVSPVEFLVELSAASRKRFGVGAAVEAVDLLTWLLNALHADLTAEDVGERVASEVAAAHRAAGAPSASAAAAAAGGAGGGGRAGTAASGGAASAAASASAGAGSSLSSTSATASIAASSSSSSGAKRPRSEGGGPGGAARQRSSIITDVFAGEVEVTVLSSELEEEASKAGAGGKRAPGEKGAAAGRRGEGGADDNGGATASASSASASSASAASASTAPLSVTRVPFLCLSLDLPPAPLFSGDGGGMVLPQIPLATLLAKFDGVTITDSLRGQYRERKRYRLIRLPPYLALAVRRFTRNAFFTDKNPTIVTFPVRALEMRPFVHEDSLSGVGVIGEAWPAAAAAGGEEPLAGRSVASLRALAAKLSARGAARRGGGGAAGAADGGAASGGGGIGSAALEKGELVAAVRGAVDASACTRYDLCANIMHDSPPTVEKGGEDPLTSGTYRVHLLHSAAGQWYELQDIHVQETLPEMIGISQTYIMIYKRAVGSTPPPPSSSSSVLGTLR